MGFLNYGFGFMSKLRIVVRNVLEETLLFYSIKSL